MTVPDRYRAAHDHPQGVDDDRPSALQIVKDAGLEGRLHHAVVIVTGASSGIGRDTAGAMLAAGCQVVMAVRNQQKGRAAMQEIEQATAHIEGRGSLKLMQLELSSLQSVREFVKAFNQQFTQLNILINNAAASTDLGPESRTADGFEMQFGTNHLAHFLLFTQLKDLLVQSSKPGFHSRVICVSSVAHRDATVRFDDLDLKQRGYSTLAAYGQSKTANVWTANEIERRYGAQGLHAWSVHPGFIMTQLPAAVLPAPVMEALKTDSYQRMMKSTAQGAATSAWAALSPDLEGQGGLYLEDCRVSEAVADKEGVTPLDLGYAAHAYDAAGAAQLWDVSCQMLGVHG